MRSNVSKAFGDNLLMANMSFSLPPGGIIGVIGPNGAGKTTLFRMITGQEKPDSGEFKVGESVKLAYVEQSRESLGTEQSVWQAISDGKEIIKLGNAARSTAGRMSRASVSPAPINKRRVGVLSGGERNRVHLAACSRAARM